jgi:hypothetical protein
MKIIVFALLAVVAMGSGTLAFAETFEIKIPSGASDPGAPFFWSEKTTGVTTGEITVFPGDSVTWLNADTAFHTITSVTQSGEPDDTFDSGFFTAGDSYTQKFDELGDFYYYCSLHPFMSGVVHVVKNPGSVQTIDRVGSGFSDDGLGFKIKYILDTKLANAVHVDPDKRTLTFTITDESQIEQLTLILPPKLIENPNAVWVDGKMVEFQSTDTSTGLKLLIPITSDSREVKVMGTYVIPEFGFLAVGVLLVGLISVLFLAKSKFPMLQTQSL